MYYFHLKLLQESPLFWGSLTKEHSSPSVSQQFSSNNINGAGEIAWQF